MHLHTTIYVLAAMWQCNVLYPKVRGAGGNYTSPFAPEVTTILLSLINVKTSGAYSFLITFYLVVNMPVGGGGVVMPI